MDASQRNGSLMSPEEELAALANSILYPDNQSGIGESNNRQGRLGEDAVANSVRNLFGESHVFANGMGKGKRSGGPDVYVMNDDTKMAIEVKLWDKTGNWRIKKGGYRSLILSRFNIIRNAGYQKVAIIMGRPPKNIGQIEEWCEKDGIELLVIRLKEEVLKPMRRIVDGLSQVVFDGVLSVASKLLSKAITPFIFFGLNSSGLIPDNRPRRRLFPIAKHLHLSSSDTAQAALFTISKLDAKQQT